MDERIKRVYAPMTESSFYILLSLIEENHGYGIIQNVKELTNKEIILTPGTIYGSLSKMEKDGLIKFVKEDENRKLYKITDLGKIVLNDELKRIKRLYKNSMEVKL